MTEKNISQGFRQIFPEGYQKVISEAFATLRRDKKSNIYPLEVRKVTANLVEYAKRIEYNLRMGLAVEVSQKDLEEVIYQKASLDRNVRSFERKGCGSRRVYTGQKERPGSIWIH